MQIRALLIRALLIRVTATPVRAGRGWAMPDKATLMLAVAH